MNSSSCKGFDSSVEGTGYGLEAQILEKAPYLYKIFVDGGLLCLKELLCKSIVFGQNSFTLSFEFL